MIGVRGERCVLVEGLAVTEMKTAECGLTEVVGPAATRLSLGSLQPWRPDNEEHQTPHY